MSKDVVIAGVIVAACLGLVTVAFVVPKQKTVTTTEIAQNDPLPPTTPADPIIGPSDLFANNTNTFTPIPDPTNPFTRNTTTYPPSGKPPSGVGSGQFPPALQPPGMIEPPPTLPTVSQAKTHVVGTGETLGEISAKYYGTAKNWKKIAEANKVDPSDLKVGQKLTIPAIESVVAVNQTVPDLASGERSYTIQKNDSYYSIAKKELGNAGRWKELEKLNGLPSEDLRIGKVIKLPAKAAAVEPLTPGPEAPSANDPNTHVVKSGETLSDISKQHYGTTTKWKEIIKANPGIDPEGLKVGQKLKIPEIAGTTPSPTPFPGTSAPADNPAATYTVKAGEYLEDIALSQLGARGAWKKIVDANPGIDPKKLRVGQKLVIPGKSAPAPEPAPAPKPSGFGTQPSGFGTQPSGFGTQPSGFGAQPSGFGAQPSSSFDKPSSSGFGSQPAGGSAYPAPVGTPPASPGSTPPSDNPFGLPPSAGTRPVP